MLHLNLPEEFSPATHRYSSFSCGAAGVDHSLRHGSHHHRPDYLRQFVIADTAGAIWAACNVCYQKSLQTDGEFKTVAESDVMVIDDMGIDRRLWRHGLGRALIAAAVFAVKRGPVLTQVKLTSIDATVPFYEKSGFQKLDSLNRMRLSLDDMARQRLHGWILPEGKLIRMTDVPAAPYLSRNPA